MHFRTLFLATFAQIILQPGVQGAPSSESLSARGDPPPGTDPPLCCTTDCTACVSGGCGKGRDCTTQPVSRCARTCSDTDNTSTSDVAQQKGSNKLC